MARRKAPSLQELGYLPELLTTSQAAEFLQLSQDHLRVLLRTGQLHGVRVTGSWRIPRDVILSRLDPAGAETASVVAGMQVSDSQPTVSTAAPAGLSDSQAKPESMTQREAAERLGLSQKTISRMLARGTLTPQRTGRIGGATRVTLDSRWAHALRSRA